MLTLALAITTAVTLAGLHFLHVQHFKPERQLTAATLFNLLKVAFAVAAGIGAVVALVTAYRRQRIAEFADRRQELAEQREQTRLFNERFTAAAGQLGHDNPAIRLAGVYAMAGLADDWPQQRQTCVDVLCAYLRMPYPRDPAAVKADREVRDTIIRVITAHLQPNDWRPPTAASWHGLNLDFTGVVFQGGDFRGARFSGGHINFSGAWFSGGRVNFIGAWFTGATVSFDGAKFTGGRVSFSGARFTGGQVSFSFAQFTGSQVDFDDAQFTGATVGFSSARFTNSQVDFSGSRFSFGRVTFILAQFTGGDVHLSNASFTGGHVSFGSATFAGGHVDFSNSRFAGALVQFDRANFTSAGVDFTNADFTAGLVDFSEPGDWSSPPQFPDWGNNPPQPVRLPASSPAP